MSWAGHADYRTTIKHYLKVSSSDFDRATGMTQKVTQKPETGTEETPEPVSEVTEK
jgi:hypothetical protein